MGGFSEELCGGGGPCSGDKAVKYLWPTSDHLRLEVGACDPVGISELELLSPDCGAPRTSSYLQPHELWP